MSADNHLGGKRGFVLGVAVRHIENVSSPAQLVSEVHCLNVCGVCFRQDADVAFVFLFNPQDLVKTALMVLP